MRVTIVDDSGELGGGQMGLARYLACESVHERTLLSARPGRAWEATVVGNQVSVEILGGATSRAGLYARSWTLYEAIRRSNPEIVFSNSLRAAIMLSLCPKLKNVRYMHYLLEPVSKEWLGRAKAILVGQRVMPKFDGYVGCSEWCMRSLSERLSDRPRSVVFSLAGVSVAVQRGQPVLSAERLKLVYLGRIARWKRPDLILEALRLMEGENGGDSGCSLKIVGDSSYGDRAYGEALRSSADRLSTEVEFVGHVDDPCRLLAEEDVLVVASSPPEPFGQVVVQGLAAGMCVVAPSVGGPAEILDSGRYGELFREGDAVDLARVLTSLRLQPSKVCSFSDLAVERAMAFSDSSISQALDAAISDLAGRTSLS